MDNSEFKIVRQIFNDALGCDPEARAHFLEKACEGDGDRRREVEQLLAAHDSGDSWVDGQVAQSIIRATSVTLKPGEKIGSYEILGLLGVGGMGEVYRAQDTSLASRHVAIKVLPDAFSRDPERIGRFEREALVLASLNHTNIGAIHHVIEAAVEAKVSRFLVLELVEGETLAVRISRGALSLEETLPLARQIVDALDYAHDKGVVHRDLKPANIKVTPDDHVKVLDFGLAKVRDDPGSDPKQSVTFETTEPSRILGTAPYMSPEQASGKEADRRSDIWAFGCVLYEMLSGHVLFRGESVSEILAEVLKSEPDFKGLPQSTPPAIRRLLRRCLQKDRKRRLRHIGDARLEIEDAAAGIEEAPGGGVPLRTVSRREWIAWATAAAAVAAGAGAAAWFATRRSTLDGPRIRFARYATLPTLDPVSLAISPDGEKIVFASTTGTESQLWLLKPGESETPTVLPETSGAYLPFWSPDSQWVGFFANSQLKKTRIDGGLPENLVKVSLGRGGTWSSSGKILYASNPGTWISMVDAQTTEVQKVTQLERGHVSHRFPQFVDDSRFLYHVTGKAEVGGIYGYDLNTKTTARLLFSPEEAVETALFAPPGFLLFLIQGKLYVQDFDAQAMTLAGERSLVKDVNQSARVMVNTAIYRAALSVAKDCLIYRTGSAPGERQLSWRDAAGKEIGLVGSSDNWGPLNPSLSPNGNTVILDRTAVETGNTNIFRINATPRAPGSMAAEYAPLTTHEKPDYSPVWSPIGDRFVYSNNENGPWDLYEMQLRGGAAKLIKSTEESKFASDWSSDGEYILYRSINPEGGYDLRALHYPTAQEVEILPKGNPADERDGQFSRDMKWIAYASNERDDRFEIYVVPFSRDARSVTEGGEKISSGGGTQPRWGRQSRDSAELFYLNSTGSLMRVLIAVSSDGRPSVVERPVKLFDTGIPAENPVGAYGQQYAVRIDGDTVRFLLNVPKVVDPQPLHLIAAIDWASR
jgi:serine/threonine protein kinase